MISYHIIQTCIRGKARKGKGKKGKERVLGIEFVEYLLLK
jgi:hypothetical protein